MLADEQRREEAGSFSVLRFTLYCGLGWGSPFLFSGQRTQKQPKPRAPLLFGANPPYCEQRLLIQQRSLNRDSVVNIGREYRWYDFDNSLTNSLHPRRRFSHPTSRSFAF